MPPFHKKRGVPDGNPINAGALAVGDWVGGGWRKVIFRGMGVNSRAVRCVAFVCQEFDYCILLNCL